MINLRGNNSDKNEFSSPYETPEYMSDSDIHNLDFERKFHKKFILSIAAFGIVFLGLIIHIMNWDEHSISIIPLKISETLGMASPQSLREIARICESRLKYSCSESALSEAAAIEPNVNDFIKLGDLQRKIFTPQQAVKSYSSAIKIMTKENSTEKSQLSDAYYGLAKSYENLGQNSLAEENYDLAIKSKPDVILITVTAAYINLLKNIGKIDVAKAVIKEAQKRGGSEALFSGAL